MKRIAVHAVICLTLVSQLVGCVSPQPFSKEQFNRLKQYSAIHVIYFKPTEFQVEPPIFLSGGSLRLLMVPPKLLAAQFVIDNSLQDPTLELREIVVGKLQTDGQLNNLKILQGGVEKNDWGVLHKQHEMTIAFTFETTQWAVIRGILDLSRYQSLYGVHVRLLDIRSFETFWERGCRVWGKAHTSDELKEGNAYLLKKEFHEAADTCSREILTDLIQKALPSS